MSRDDGMFGLVAFALLAAEYKHLLFKSGDDYRMSTQGWGKNASIERAASGKPLKLEADSDCLLVFEALKDITDQLDAKKRAGRKDRAIYVIFNDGNCVVSIPQMFALQGINWEPGAVYYLHHQGEIPTDMNPMADILVIRVGKVGETVECPDRVHPEKRIELTHSEIKAANYTRLNYPLRPAGKAKS